MSCTIAARLKGGTSGIAHKYCTHLHKIKLPEEYRRLQSEHSLSLRGAALVFGVPDSLLVKWKSRLPVLRVALNRSHCSINKGPIRQLDPIKEELLA